MWHVIFEYLSTLDSRCWKVFSEILKCLSKWTVSTKGIIVCTRNVAVTYNKEALCYRPRGLRGNENSSDKAVWSQTSMFIFRADALMLFALAIHHGIITATILSNLVKTALYFSLGVFNVPCFAQHEWLPWLNPILLNLLCQIICCHASCVD